ncbi:SO_0444 family Cu/Zn efflux transporter [Paraferrimonas haliotis]|uniref:SO_0444 family Cu/Zn efflux transporter n=1 Tax=Paraferrimonas haliotis TaxID=2013866 RepID=UPI000BA991B4|nr:SO_0444 family Cu/Zn efflux transporter [Paraferrimonas haliotis]
MLLNNFIDLFLDSAPWLLLGLVLAGIIKVFVPMAWMQKQLGGNGFKPTFKAALLGAPLPLCSCGVIPAAVGLRRAGASKSATTAFMVATPETGVDSVSVSVVLLGPFLAIVRPIAAITSAIVAGLLVGRDDDAVTETAAAKPAASGCCSSKSEPVVKASGCCSSKSEPVTKASGCCSSKSEPVAKASGCCSSKQDVAVKPQASLLAKLTEGLKFAATDLVRDTSMWLLVGLFFAALVTTYVPADFLAKWGNGLLAMLVMVLVSVPMYICATASTPIAAGLLLAGVSPGAVLVFMLAGPATNIATLGVITKELGKRALFGYLGGVLGCAILFGLLTNFAVSQLGIQVQPQVGHEHRLLPMWLTISTSVILAILMARVAINKLLQYRQNDSKLTTSN